MTRPGAYTNLDGTPVPPYKPPRWEKITCSVCTSCWYDHVYGQCAYGGPFSGYVDATTGKKIEWGDSQ